MLVVGLLLCPTTQSACSWETMRQKNVKGRSSEYSELYLQTDGGVKQLRQLTLS